MDVRVPSWVELMGRHAAAGTLFLSASMRFTDSDTSAPVDDEYRFWHGPDNRWRIESEAETIYVRNPQTTLLRGGDGQMRRLEGRITIPLLGPVTPIEMIGQGSMLLHMSESVRIGPVSSTILDGRQGWSVILTHTDADPALAVLDDETGMTARMELPGGAAVASISDISVYDDLPESVFAWDGPIDGDPPSPSPPIDHHRARLDILTAIERALDRRTEVFEVVARSAEPADAAAAVGRLLDVEPSGAEAVLALQLRRFSSSERAKISSELDELQRDPPPVD